jgi:hypothetical protein
LRSVRNALEQSHPKFGKGDLGGRRRRCRGLFNHDLGTPSACGLDDRPPFLDLRLLQRGKCLRILLIGRHNFLPDFRKALTDSSVS